MTLSHGTMYSDEERSENCKCQEYSERPESGIASVEIAADRHFGTSWDVGAFNFGLYPKSMQKPYHKSKPFDGKTTSIQYLDCPYATNRRRPAGALHAVIGHSGRTASPLPS